MKARLTKGGIEVLGSDSLVYLVRGDYAKQCRAHAMRLVAIHGPRWADGANLYRDSLLNHPCGKVDFTIVHAWTGGDSPPPEFTHPLVEALTQEQIRDWKDYWGDTPPEDVLELFEGRARFDAWASVRP